MNKKNIEMIDKIMKLALNPEFNTFGTKDLSSIKKYVDLTPFDISSSDFTAAWRRATHN